MPYVNVPNDLSKIKTKIAFNLTKRQLICFGIGAAIGVPTYLLTRQAIGNTGALFAIDKWRGRTADKRGGGEIVLALDELADCVPSDHSVEREVEAATLEKIINDFVMSLPLMERRVFICRYWYLDPISAIAEQFGFSQSKVKMILHRQRQKLQSILEREAFL